MLKLTNASTTSTLREDEDGFLRGSAIVLKAGVMEYKRHQLPNIPDHVKGDTIRLNVSRETLEDAEALKSLEGKPITTDHAWRGIDQNSSVGCVSGAPVVEFPYLMCDFLLNDKNTRDRVKTKDESLVEVSSGYRSNIDWDVQGQDFHGEQTNIRFNHVRLLPRGEGRAGRDVRILNKKEQEMADDNTDAKTETKTDSGLDTVLADIKENTLKMNELEKQISDLRTENTHLREKLEAAERERDRNQGELDSTKEKLLNASSQENILNAAKAFVKEQDTAVKVLNSNNLEMDDTLKSLSGSGLQRAVLNRVQNAKSKPQIDDAKSDDYVAGCFNTAVEGLDMVKTAPAGSADLITNSREGDVVSGFILHGDSPEIRREKFLNNLKGGSK